MYRRKPTQQAPQQTPFVSRISPSVIASAPPTQDAPTTSTDAPTDTVRLSVLWRKATNKKHVTWEGDAPARFKDGKLTASLDHSSVCVPISEVDLVEGKTITAGRFVLEISEIKTNSRPSSGGALPLAGACKTTSAPVRSSVQQFKPVRPSSEGQSRTVPVVKRPKSYYTKEAETSQPVKPATVANLMFKRPRISEPKEMTTETISAKVPTDTVPVKVPKKLIATIPEVTAGGIAIDSQVEPLLRPHQKEAVRFLCDCLTGDKHRFGYGALLADDMGLGKTLTTIALICTLLSTKLIKNALVVMPVSVIGHWKAEFKKWLGDRNIGVLAALPGVDIQMFTKGGIRSTYQVLLAGYEKMRDISAMIETDLGTVDLIVCDEGHRLKSKDSQTMKAIKLISGDRRVVLTGTPVQNDLSEFYTLADYINPGIFGDLSKFQRKYESVLCAAREPGASDLVIEAAKETADELLETVEQFMLRRDIAILAEHLNIPKSEYVVLCKPTELQLAIYNDAVHGYQGVLDSGLGGARALEAISMLRKLANSASLQQNDNSAISAHQIVQLSGKLQVAARLLSQLAEREEKVVVVCSSTAMLDLIQKHIINMGRGWVRLDGSTPQTKRQSSVDLFNKSSFKRTFAFLLSSRSGGAGLSLVGAANLIMFDCDWNPAVDLQAMARIHRDGQKSATTIYRLLTSGTIDEKIFQRQISKRGLASSIVDVNVDHEKFSRDELRDLFSLSENGSSFLDLNTLDSYTLLEVGMENFNLNHSLACALLLKQ